MSQRLRKIVISILILCIMASLVGVSAPALASAGTFRTTSRVNIRAEASTDSAVVSVVNSGANVEVIDHNPAGWSKVTAGGSTGFIRSDFLKFPISNSATFKATAGVNVRSTASTDSSVVATVEKGSNVDVTEHDPAGWSKVRVGGKNGFIRSDFLTRGGDGSAAGTEASGAAVSSGSSSGSSSSGSSSSGTAVATLRTTGRVNIRSGASTNHSIVRTLAANTSVEVLENQSDGWSSVRVSGATGFIRSDLLSTSGSSQSSTLKTTGTVNLRSASSTSSSVIRTLSPNTSVEVVENQANGWSSVRHNGTTGFIRSDLLSATGSSSSSTTLKTVTGVNMRSGPSTSHSRISLLPVNTSVEVLEKQSNGWSRVRHNGTVGFIRSDLLGTGARVIELLDWSAARGIVPTGVNLDIVDVKTGIRFQLRGFSKSGHIDVEPPTQEDTAAILRTRNGVWAWTPRPVWVTVGGRTFAAALNGMPHDVSTIRNNGMSGHLCLHFGNTVTRSQSYQRDLRAAVIEAYNARSR